MFDDREEAIDEEREAYYKQRELDQALMEDIRDIASKLSWDTPTCTEQAWRMILEIQAGKYGSQDGVWVQAKKALERLRNE